METTLTAPLASTPIPRLQYVKMNSNSYITRDTQEFIWRNVYQTYTMEKSALTDRGRHEADRGRHEADRGRHEADRGPHEADRGPHEAEQEKTKFLGPKFCRSGIGILRKGEVIP
ncbi:hypothetical protein T03_17127 [Trichinella britovi]|uniref:Uncharacterized protein n=1 Tax=Trichinella britovi TaxID=45882 RepID=A0A0V1CJE8_TRIBR|nr:hypothetical protein T03_17127 [Trichinella britovi]